MYYKFKYMDFYGGINTAYANGCNLLCAYCFNHQRNENLLKSQASFYKPSEVVLKLRKLADKNDCQVCRISGCEAILGDRSTLHLATIIKSMPGFRFVIESNGLMLGANPQLIGYFDCLRDRDILFRICLKADNALTFSKVTGAKSDYWHYPLDAIKLLKARGFDISVGFMKRFVDPQKLGLPEDILDEESLRYYQGTKLRLVERGID